MSPTTGHPRSPPSRHERFRPLPGDQPASPEAEGAHSLHERGPLRQDTVEHLSSMGAGSSRNPSRPSPSSRRWSGSPGRSHQLAVSPLRSPPVPPLSRRGLSANKPTRRAEGAAFISLDTRRNRRIGIPWLPIGRAAASWPFSRPSWRVFPSPGRRRRGRRRTGDGFLSRGGNPPVPFRRRLRGERTGIDSAAGGLAPGRLPLAPFLRRLSVEVRLNVVHRRLRKEIRDYGERFGFLLDRSPRWSRSPRAGDHGVTSPASL